MQSWRDRIGFLTEGDPQIHEQNRLKLLKILQEEGVEILFGTDAPQLFSVPGFSIHHEIDAMEKRGQLLRTDYLDRLQRLSDTAKLNSGV